MRTVGMNSSGTAVRLEPVKLTPSLVMDGVESSGFYQRQTGQQTPLTGLDWSGSVLEAVMPKGDP
eukprot:IDg2097t1